MKIMDYEKLLDKAYKEVKPIKASERFKVPEIESRVEGNKTIIVNFKQILDYLRRKPEHVSKFLSKELASYAQIDGNRLILNRKLSPNRITEKLEKYIKEFVICKECQKPDTELVKQDRFYFIHCLACGAKHSVRNI